MRQILRCALPAAIASLITATAMSWADNPDPSGVITACVNTGGLLREQGATRIPPDGACSERTEQIIRWNQQGPPGPAGPRGPRGLSAKGSADTKAILDQLRTTELRILRPINELDRKVKALDTKVTALDAKADTTQTTLTKNVLGLLSKTWDESSRAHSASVTVRDQVLENKLKFSKYTLRTMVAIACTFAHRAAYPDNPPLDCDKPK